MKLEIGIISDNYILCFANPKSFLDPQDRIYLYCSYKNPKQYVLEIRIPPLYERITPDEINVNDNVIKLSQI